jgi:branched-chain amino acid transport system substrate-binding protein
VTRRSLSHGSNWSGLTRLAALVAVFVTALVVAACGGDDNKKSDGTSSGSSPSAATSPQATEFRKLLGISDAEAAKLKGKTFKIGSILPLSGPGANFAVDEGNGTKLAIDEMQRYLGLKVDYKSLDNKTGDPQAGAATARELGIDGYGAVVNSYGGAFGSTLPALAQYKMLSFDPGGGTQNTFQGKPYFWGFRGTTPDTGYPFLQYFKQEIPTAKRFAIVVYDAGAAYADPVIANAKKQAALAGLTFAGVVKAPIGATDYATVLSKLKGLNPDIVSIGLYGTDPGYFMKQYATSGLTAQVVGGELTPTGSKIAGAGYKNYWFAADFFDVNHPANPLSKHFLTEYKRLFGEVPATFYQPNYYEGTIAFLQLAVRVLDKGGDINSGEQLQQALLANPTFKSVYGGDDKTVGTLTLNTTTHDPTTRPIGLFTAQPEVKQLAEWNIDGGNFKVVSKPPAS